MKKKYFSLADKIHPYPAKYTIEMIEDYIMKYTQEGDTILDPFVGSGTTILASRKHNRNAIGFDINPIAYHISIVKSLNYDSRDVAQINKIIRRINKDINDNLEINKDYLLSQNIEVVDYDNLYHWFREEVILTFSYIRHLSLNNDNYKVMYFLQLILSLITIDFSNQESDTRYAAKDKGITNSTKILQKYIEKAEKSLDILYKLGESSKLFQIYLEDSKELDKIVDKEIDMIITSPPYPNTYDYYLYHKHRMLWLGYDYKVVMNSEIGSRREFSSLKRPVSNFTNDLLNILSSANKILKKAGYILIIIGDGVVQGNKYRSDIETKKIGKKMGWEIIDEVFTELDNTSKKFQASFREKGKKEHYLLFRKV